mmetsp:Transcript_8663/g.16936  ORF Transcript_8663/g.16936 Transcript_8663/m.16936 type:complete len:216 (-) Transcript_8663:23-670(-)
MSEMYRSFEQDFIRYLNSVHRKTALLNTQAIEQKQLAVSEGKLEASEADKCLRQMEIETFMLPVEKRSLMQAEVRKYREDLDSQKKLLKREEELISTIRTKDTLMGSSSSTFSGGSRSQLRGTELLLDQNARLEEGRRAALEAEGLAIGSMHALKGQRDQIHKMTQNAHEINDNLGGSNKLLTTMQRRAITNKLTMVGIVAMLLLAIGLVIYFKM